MKNNKKETTSKKTINKSKTTKTNVKTIKKAPEKRNASFDLVEVIVIIIFTAIIVGITTSVIVYKNYDNIKSSDNTVNSDNNDSELKEFKDAYNQIINSYVENVDREELIDAAIEGMYSKLGDEYTTYIDESVSSDLKEQLQGEYEGIGVEITKLTDGNILISDVFEGGTAAKAGLLIGDIITEINNESVINLTLEEAANKIKSSQTAQITYKRNEKEHSVNLDIKLVQIPSVSTEQFDDKGYIYISTFSSTTYNQFKTALEEIENNKIKSLVIDLRGNTGGYLHVAKQITELFLKKDEKIYGLKYKDNSTEFFKDTTAESRNYKISVLINSASASASEILASALQESYGAKLVGTTSYGKGTVQETKDLSTGSMVKFTTAYWLTPNGTSIEGIGVKPDIEVNLNKYDEYSYEVDNQLQEALKAIN